LRCRAHVCELRGPRVELLWRGRVVPQLRRSVLRAGSHEPVEIDKNSKAAPARLKVAPHSTPSPPGTNLRPRAIRDGDPSRRRHISHSVRSGRGEKTFRPQTSAIPTWRRGRRNSFSVLWVAWMRLIFSKIRDRLIFSKFGAPENRKDVSEPDSHSGRSDLAAIGSSNRRRRVSLDRIHRSRRVAPLDRASCRVIARLALVHRQTRTPRGQIQAQLEIASAIRSPGQADGPQAPSVREPE
jgi:hypothetical protein